MSNFILPPIAPVSPLLLPCLSAVGDGAPAAPVESIPAPPLPPANVSSPAPRPRTARAPRVATEGASAPASVGSRVAACVDPAVGFAAAVVGIVATKVPSGQAAARVLPWVSSGLWTASGAAGAAGSVGELLRGRMTAEPSTASSRQWSHALNATASGLNGLAGGLSLRTPSMLRSGFESGAWAASGVVKMARAAVPDGRPVDSRLLEAGSGALTIAAAGLSTKALAVAADDPAGAVFYTLVSSAAWAAADGLGGLAACAALRQPAPGPEARDPASIEAP